jgi:UDP-N-acetylglucosamine 1-carboxyvinyltransferase
VADGCSVDAEVAELIRASFLVAGPLLARFGRVCMPPPGGDVIGRRRLDPHLDAFRALGASVEHTPDGIHLEAPIGLRPCDFLMDEPSVMATENALMAAALTRGPTVIRNAACEPHVQDLARMLVAMGAPIDGIGSNVMTVHGTGGLRGCTHTIAPDHIEIGSFMALAGVTGGELIVKDTVPEDLRMIRLVFERLGLRSEIRGSDVIVPGNQELRIRNDAGEYMPKVEDGPWPAFPADLTSIALALATQAEGSVIIHEKMFENRLFFCDKLQLMGAAITICDPHRAIVLGPRRLTGQRVDSPDIRAGMAMVIAALCAEGVTEIGNVRHIDRGYERIDERLRHLGARIQRVDDVPAVV